MTFEERLDRLTERHEALVMYHQLLSADIRQISESVAKLEHIAAQSLESVNALVRVAESHERRITHLEDQQGIQ